jgi:DNA-binding CsgD family transcriptional regulator
VGRPGARRTRGDRRNRKRRGPATIDELTPQELQIALALAGGKTTKETAAALFLSPKTVEYHLRHVYQKLGIHSREELPERSPPTAPNKGCAGVCPADATAPSWCATRWNGAVSCAGCWG